VYAQIRTFRVDLRFREILNEYQTFISSLDAKHITLIHQLINARKTSFVLKSNLN